MAASASENICQFECGLHLAIASSAHFHGDEIDPIFWMVQVANSYSPELLRYCLVRDRDQVGEFIRKCGLNGECWDRLGRIAKMVMSLIELRRKRNT